MGITPTASTTAALVMGDALALALLKARNFTKEDFASLHPGGVLGKRLILRAYDIMQNNPRIPCVRATASLRETLKLAPWNRLVQS